MYLYKESDILNELPLCDANFIRNSDININTDIVELIEQLEDLMQKNGIETESGMILEGIVDKLSTVNVDKKYYRIIFVEPDFSDGVSLYAMSDINDFQIGDEVVIKTRNDEVDGIVREVAYYTKEHLPSPPEDMYSVTEITYREEE